MEYPVTSPRRLMAKLVVYEAVGLPAKTLIVPLQLRTKRRMLPDWSAKFPVTSPPSLMLRLFVYDELGASKTVILCARAEVASPGKRVAKPSNVIPVRSLIVTPRFPNVSWTLLCFQPELLTVSIIVYSSDS